MWWFIAELLIDFGFSALLELGFEKGSKYTPEQEELAFSLFVFLVVGVFFGLLTAVLVPWRILPPGPFKGVSLVVLPLFLGASLDVLGQLRKEKASHLATWYGGGVLGLGLAAGRLAVLLTLVR